MPEGNHSIIWANDLDYYSRYSGRIDSILLVDPGCPQRRAAWDLYFRRFPPIIPHGKCQPKTDVVVAIGDALFPIASYYGSITGRDALCADTLENLFRNTFKFSTAVFILPPETLRARWLLSIAELSELHGFSYGIITGHDVPAISYLAAKAAFSLVIPGKSVASIEAIHNYPPRVFSSCTRELTLEDALTHPWTAFSISAHGEGAHLLLGDRVLCGLVGEHESIDGRAVPRGCTSVSCKRALMPQAFDKISQLDARVLALLSCNSLSTSNQLLPNGVSLVLSAADANPMAIIANPFGTPFHPDVGEIISKLISSGSALGKIAQYMSQQTPTPFGGHSYVLIGDPMAAIAFDNSSALVSGIQSDSNTAEIDGTGDEQKLNWLVAERARIEQARALVLGAGRRLLSPASSDHFLAAHAQQLAIEEAFSNLVARYRAHALSRFEMNRYLAESLRWDAAFAALLKNELLDSVVGDGLIEAVNSLAAECYFSKGAACQRCGETVAVHHLLPVGKDNEWLLEECPICGPLSVSSLTGPTLQLFVKSPIAPGKPISITIGYDLSSELEIAHIVVEFRDKAKSRSLYRDILTCDSKSSTCEVLLRLPLDANFDQFTIRAILVYRLLPAYRRALLIPLPYGI